MREDPTADLLEKCLRDLQAGEALDSVLAKYGPDAEALRPVLEMASGTRLIKPPIRVSPAAKARSKAEFLAAAEQARSRHPRWSPVFNLRAAASIAMVVIVLLALVGSGLASAKSIPGDTLYPMKRAVEQARLSLAPDPATKLQLEETFDQERAEESQRVVLMGRSEEVTFAGVLEFEQGEGWETAGVPLSMSTDQQQTAQGLKGLYVEVVGMPSGARMLVKSISARLFTISGPIEQAQADTLVVGGITVHLTPKTDVRTALQRGTQVYVTATRRDNNDLTALVVSPAPAQATYAPSGEQEGQDTTTPEPQPTQGSSTSEPQDYEHGLQPSQTPSDPQESVEPKESEIQPTPEHNTEPSKPSEDGGDHSSESGESGDH